MLRQNRILERVVHGADLDTEPLPSVPLIELAGEHRVLIENHCGVVEYGSNEIRIKVKYGQVCICGNGLKLTLMSKERLIIVGRIESVHLIRKR